jgi:DNA polymerase-4
VTVRAINLASQDIPQQIDLFTDYHEIDRKERLESVIENIRDRFGKHSIMPATLYQNIKMPTDRETELRMPTGMVM